MSIFDRLLGKGSGNKASKASKGSPLKEGLALHSAGRLAEARAIYTSISEGLPEHAEALHMLGVICSQEGRDREAVELIERSLSIDQGNAPAFYNRGLALKRLGEHQLAVASFDRAVGARPDYAEAYSARGLSLHELGRIGEAVESFRLAIGVRPEMVEAHYNLGRTQQQAGHLEAALASFSRAIALQPLLAQAYHNRGAVLRELMRPGEALPEFDQALRLKPDDPLTHAARAATLLTLGMNDDALDGFNAALRLRPESPDILVGRGMALSRLGRPPEAIESFEKAVSLDSESADAYFNLGLAHDAAGNPEAALQCMLRARELAPDYEYLEGAILQIRMDSCDWSNRESDTAAIVAKVRAGRRCASPFTMLAATDLPDVQLEAARVMAGHRYPANDALGPLPRSRRRGALRVGYFSADFRNHAVSHLTAALFESHDRARVVPMGFSFGPPDDDEMKRRVERALDVFHEVNGCTDEQVARLARDHELDIAIDLGGFTEHSRTGIFACRAAPVQASYLGYLGTMGAPYIDYLLADGTLVPEGSRLDFTEKIVYLPSYHVSDRVREAAQAPARVELGLPDEGVVYGCLNNSYKISPARFASWMRILRRVVGSVLVLNVASPLARSNLLSEASRSGVAGNRLCFLAPAPRPDYLARLSMIDVFLDTHPYSAGTLGNDALWAGVPIITCPGHSLASRMAASVLRSAALTELVASSEEDYETRAVELGTHPARLLELKQRILAERARSPLFDANWFARNLEAAFEAMVERREHGETPDHLVVRSA